jgi:hypothetical protein
LENNRAERFCLEVEGWNVGRWLTKWIKINKIKEIQIYGKK